MGNCENMCVDQKHKLMVEMEKENSMEEINKNRFKNIVKDKSEIFSSQSIEKSPSQISQKESKTVNKIQNFENGCVYEGEWHEEFKRHGQGKYTWQDGSVYVGEWQHNKAAGFGKLEHADGDVYEGQWADDKANGYGEYTQKNGIVYKGTWKDDKQCGRGVETWGESAKYEGDYLEGKKHGFGVLVFNDGSSYEVR